MNDASSWGWVVLAILAMALIGGCFIATWLVRSVIIPLNTLANLLGRAGRWARNRRPAVLSLLSNAMPLSFDVTGTREQTRDDAAPGESGRPPGAVS